MKQIAIILLGCMLVLSSCSPKISTSISKNYPPLDYREDVRVYDLQEAVPANAEKIGVVKIGDTGFSTDCSWEVVLDKAKVEARKAGGNAIKITKHKMPNPVGSSCHRITAEILKVENSLSMTETVSNDYNNSTPKTFAEQNSFSNEDFAILYVYRTGGMGALVSYDLHLDDTILCRVSNNFKKTIIVRQDGLKKLWAKTEALKEVPIDIEFGKEYYVRCSMSMGAFVGHPEIEVVDNQSGKLEFQSIRLKKSERWDLIITKDGTEIECIINDGDAKNVYYTITENGIKTQAQISKSEIKTVQLNQ